MQDYGLLIDYNQLNTTGKIVRCPTKSKPYNKNGWYVVYINGNFITAVFGDYQRNESPVKWCDKSKLSIAEKNQIQTQAILNQQRTKIDKQNELAIMRDNFYKLTHLLINNHSYIHPYIKNKGISEYLNMSMKDKLRIDNFGNLIIPLRNIDDELMGYQRISADGNKIFAKWSVKKRNFYNLIAEDLSIANCDLVFIGEGFATMASVYIAVNEYLEGKNYCCIVAFDVGNIKPVVDVIWQWFKNKPITLIADNDCNSEINVGVSTCNKIKQLYPDKPITIFIPTRQ